ncbi:DUF4870 domain-containing protein [Pseudomonas sp. SDI]|uniref:DUF4870 domain-containing protein n=1 Tax=Pseudomonas sp. SDI TaxID=2170734 RepID=UPI000DE6674D|nr:DUF4870 domain-containing protein [Pseudomonas sp. SDI]PWB30300.1 DUF4870 domain-containing protein [Pseudomonas sp. SDI]
MADESITLPLPGEEARKWAMLCHLSAVIGLFFPFGNVVAPLLLWLWKKDSDPYVDTQGKEALNFQITVTLAGMACVVTAALIIGSLMFPVVVIAAIVLAIMAAVKAKKGAAYRYPLAWRPLN